MPENTSPNHHDHPRQNPQPNTSPTLTEIAFVLDRSGSMTACQEDAIAGFNHFLREQAAEPEGVHFSLVLFNETVELTADRVPIDQIAPLTPLTYQPGGSTALLDAVGHTIDKLGKQLAAMPAPERPGQVIVAILTDGYENSSQDYSWEEVAQRVERQTTVYNWTFFFLGANQDAWDTGQKMAMRRANTATYRSDGTGTAAAQQALSKKSRGMRLYASTGKYNADAMAPLDAMVHEEDSKERAQRNKKKP
jgi:uncharacterized protein YegL